MRTPTPTKKKGEEPERPLRDRDSRPVLPDPNNSEFARLRRFYLGPLVVSRMRRRRQYLAEMEVPRMPELPSAAVLARTIADKSRWLRHLPPDALQRMCEAATFHFGFGGELVVYPRETANSHGVLVLLSGSLGVMKRDKKTTTEEAGMAFSLIAEFAKMGRPPTIEVALLANTAPETVINAPGVTGELVCLADGVAPTSVRIMSKAATFAVIPLTSVRDEVYAPSLEPTIRTKVFASEILNARARTLAEHFPQTEPLLKQCWMCQDMSLGELHALAAALQPAICAPGDDIVTEGASSATMYFLRRGEAHVYVRGKQIPGAVIRPGSTFGEMGVLFCEPRMATIRAATVCDTWVLSKPALDKIVRHSPVKTKIAIQAAHIRASFLVRLPRGAVADALRPHPATRGLPEAAIARIAAAAKPAVFTAGQVMLSRAECADRVFVIHRGTCGSLDVFDDRYGPGDAVNRFVLVPHRGTGPIAAITTVDAFVVHRHDIERQLRKHGLLEEARHRMRQELDIANASVSQVNLHVLSAAEEKCLRAIFTSSPEDSNVVSRLTGGPRNHRARHVADSNSARIFESAEWNENSKLLKEDPRFINQLALAPSSRHGFFCEQLLRFKLEAKRCGCVANMPQRRNCVVFDLFGKPSAQNGSQFQGSPSLAATPVASRAVTPVPSPLASFALGKASSNVKRDISAPTFSREVRDDVALFMEDLFGSISAEDLDNDGPHTQAALQRDFVADFWKELNAQADEAAAMELQLVSPAARAAEAGKPRRNRAGSTVDDAPARFQMTKRAPTLPLVLKSTEAPKLTPVRTPRPPPASSTGPTPPRSAHAASSPRRPHVQLVM